MVAVDPAVEQQRVGRAELVGAEEVAAEVGEEVLVVLAQIPVEHVAARRLGGGDGVEGGGEGLGAAVGRLEHCLDIELERHLERLRQLARDPVAKRGERAVALRPRAVPRHHLLRRLLRHLGAAAAASDDAAAAGLSSDSVERRRSGSLSAARAALIASTHSLISSALGATSENSRDTVCR